MSPVTSTADSSSFVATRRDLRSGKLSMLKARPEENSECSLPSPSLTLLNPRETPVSERKLQHPSFSFFLFPGWLVWTNEQYQIQGQLELTAAFTICSHKDSMTGFQIVDPRDDSVKLWLECDTLSDKEGWMNALQKAIDAVWKREQVLREQ